MDRIAAIWARVSTSEQTSLPDQIARAKDILEKKGFLVPKERILAVDWTSMDLFSCPQFQVLYGWVRHKEIAAIGVLDRDRLQAVPDQRLAFLTECREAGVEWVICQGPPMLEGEMGFLIEHVYAIGKSQQVLRAREGARDGLHDKVTKDRKPSSKHKLHGYKWVGDLRLEPDDEWPVVKLIFDMVMERKTFAAIKKELETRGVFAPKGGQSWERTTIYHIVNNPVYAGRYYGLKRVVVEPKKRHGNTYGNSSTKDLLLDQAVYLPEVEVENPPITWEQFQQIQERRQKNKELAKRNARHDYLLRGVIFCETHYGKSGKPRAYHGRIRGESWVYICPVGGCSRSILNGSEIEDWAKLSTWCLLNLQPDEFYERIVGKPNTTYTEESIHEELRSLDTMDKRNINAETELETRNLLGQEDPEVYRRVKIQLQTQRKWVKERVEALKTELSQIEYHAQAFAVLQEIREKISNRLMNDLSQAEWRNLFIVLNMEIHVRDKNNPASWQGTESHNGEGLPEMDIRWGLPIKAEELGDIVFNSP